MEGPLHLVKMAVGVGDLDELRRIRAERTAQRGWSAVYTRNRPRREEALLDGGSIYWVIRGQIRVRQRVLAFHAEHDDNGRGYCLIEVDTELVPTLLRPFRPFQGWRYLPPADAPPDARGTGDLAGEPPPETMFKELKELGLI
ncbi:MAG TPA: DUF1489 domain-containing protein [Stellaceae bacterium]|jgi:hypothetical protein|nr:DUF1489 domain-containing protein [Stellaceae bacterium]